MNPIWQWILAFVGFSASSTFGSVLGIHFCSRHWQCPIQMRRQVQDWTAELEKKRDA